MRAYKNLKEIYNDYKKVNFFLFVLYVYIYIYIYIYI